MPLFSKLHPSWQNPEYFWRTFAWGKSLTYINETSHCAVCKMPHGVWSFSQGLHILCICATIQRCPLNSCTLSDETDSGADSLHVVHPALWDRLPTRWKSSSNYSPLNFPLRFGRSRAVRSQSGEGQDTGIQTMVSRSEAWKVSQRPWISRADEINRNKLWMVEDTESERSWSMKDILTHCSAQGIMGYTHAVTHTNNTCRYVMKQVPHQYSLIQT